MNSLILAASISALLFVGSSHQMTHHSYATSAQHTPAPIFVSDDHSTKHGDMMTYQVGSLTISNVVAKATLPGQPVAGGYMKIANSGSEADRLIGGDAVFAGKVEVHEMAMEGDVMKMRPVEGGLEIPAGGEVILKPGGLHIMFMKLAEPLNEGEMRDVTLEFENAGKVDVKFMVAKIKSGDSMDHSGHKHDN